MIRVLSVIGTRPEAIKLAPVLHQLECDSGTFESCIVTTGQHREMLEPMLKLFRIKPDYDLAVMVPGQSLTNITLSVMGRLEPIIVREKPDWVLVQGDTTSVMAASIVCFYNTVRVGHVEAGLRTFDRYSPFPEEINRRITGVLANFHFAPTAWARGNLLREGVPADHVRLTGNTVVDALRYVRDIDLDLDATPLRHVPLDKRIIVVTAHRNENLGLRMAGIATALRELALNHDDIHIVYPLHMNPKARIHATRRLGDLPNVSLLAPLGYQEMVWLVHHAYLVVTDSGGLQEEAAAACTPVLVLRDTTERPEGIQSGIAELVRPNHSAIVRAVGRILDDTLERARMADAPCPYGDGRSAVRIVDALAGRPAVLDPFDPIYEHPRPEHPLDALIREATACIPRPYADRVLAHVRSASDRLVGTAPR